VPAGRLPKLAVVPVPFNVAPLGEEVTVQEPEEGRPLNATFEGEIQVGSVTAPTIGAVGTDGAALIVTPGEDAAELHPASFVTE
jgi:hypothetical protein